MISNHENKRQALDWIILGLTISASTVLIPIVFPNKISLSPLLLFGIIFSTNVSTYFLPEDIPKRKIGIFTKAFFARLLISFISAGLLIWISAFASGL
ncbi:hypothetical protein [Massilia sp. GCM10023247]|uniref:hypothetical protein n=1 Tax=Massilia sp. GCM10023247 TaxID=3252643 RepID=UPI003614CCCF